MTATQKLRCLLLPLSLLAAMPSTAAPPELSGLQAAIDDLAAPQAEAELFGGVILVAHGDGVLFERAYGFSERKHRVPNTPATQFAIASVSKPMTEVLVHVLSGAGRLGLDAPVERYLPGFPKGPEGGSPTVRHLLDHRAGVPHRVTTPAEEEAEAFEAADIVARVRETGLLFEPGTDRLYSSAGFTCLARVIEVVEDKPFETVLEERVFRPAGMAFTSGETDQRVPVRALPFRLGAQDGEVVVKPAPNVDFGFLTGAGSVFATAEDLAEFVQAVRRGVFGEDLAASAFTGDPAEWQGWAGWTNGYEAYVDVRPSGDLVFVLLSNLRSAANWQLREQIHNVLSGQPTSPIALPPRVAEPFEDPEPLVGTYGRAEIRLVGGELFRGDNELYPVEGERYFIPASGSMMRFRRDATGAVDAIVSIRGDGTEAVLPRDTGSTHGI